MNGLTYIHDINLSNEDSQTPTNILLSKLAEQFPDYVSNSSVNDKSVFLKCKNFYGGYNHDRSKAFAILEYNDRYYGVEKDCINYTDILPKTDGQIVIDFNDVKNLFENDDNFSDYSKKHRINWKNDLNFNIGDNDTDYQGKNLNYGIYIIKLIMYYLEKTFDIKDILISTSRRAEVGEWVLNNPSDGSQFISSGYNLSEYINGVNDDSVSNGTEFNIPFKFTLSVLDTNFPLFKYILNTANGWRSDFSYSTIDDVVDKNDKGEAILDFSDVSNRFNHFKMPDDIKNGSSKPFYRVRFKILNTATKKKYKEAPTPGQTTYILDGFEYPNSTN